MSENSKIVYWCNNLRALAIIGVIVIHVTMNLVAFDTNNIYWNIGNLMNGLSRFSVPLFVLITGSFLLSANKEIHTKSFLQKRMIRVLIPFIFWNFLYSVYQLKLYYGVGHPFELPVFLNMVKDHWFNGAALHLWYIYILIGLYLFIPILNKWVQKASVKDFLYFILLWGISLFFFDKNSNLYYTVSSFAGFIGYLVLGYFLYIKDISVQKYILPICIYLFLLGLSITVLGTFYLRASNGYFTPVLYEFLAPNVVLMTVSIFVFAKHWAFFNQDFKILRIISQYSFGIYLIHIFILWFLERLGISYSFINPYIGIFITTALCLSVSLFILWIMAKVPVLRQVTGKV